MLERGLEGSDLLPQLLVACGVVAARRQAAIDRFERVGDPGPAGVVGARRLVLIKPPGASGLVVDAYFSGALPASVTNVIVAADQLDELRSALSRSA